MKNLENVRGGGHRSLKSSQNRAFTLAEVLITLAIIGVVAALTIPTVVNNYQKKAYYTKFMKIYNTVQNAIQLSLVDNGDLEPLRHSYEPENEGSFEKYLGNYLKVAAYCKGNVAACVPQGVYELNPLNYEVEEDMDMNIYSYLNDVQSALLDDGSLIIPISDQGLFYIDTNGAKAPNTAGRDLFMFSLRKIDGKFSFFPLGLYKNDSGETYTLEELKNGDEGLACSTTKESGGETCGARLLLEGKMDY